MICEVRGVFATVPNNAECAGEAERRGGGAHTRTHSQHTPHVRGAAAARSPRPHAGRASPSTPADMYFRPEKSVNKASLAPNEAFLPDFFGSIKQTVASFD